MNQSFKDMAIRIENAHTSFINDVMEQFNFNEKEAEKILSVFKKVKAVKIDVAMGRMNLTHGAFWDKEVMIRALAK
jgi:hypothetical protein